jgi:hypothetical protein
VRDERQNVVHITREEPKRTRTKRGEEEMSFIKKFGGGPTGAKLVTGRQGWVIGKEVKICICTISIYIVRVLADCISCCIYTGLKRERERVLAQGAIL